MKRSPKQRAKRRWKTQRDAKAKASWEFRKYLFKTVKRIKTPFGTLSFISHPALAKTE